MSIDQVMDENTLSTSNDENVQLVITIHLNGTEKINYKVSVSTTIRNLCDGIIYEISKTKKSPNDDMDWSDYNLWWPTNRVWIDQSKLNVSQYCLEDDDELVFCKTHYNIMLQLPDHQIIQMSVNFSVRVSDVMRNICLFFDIPDSEELCIFYPQKHSKGKIIMDYEDFGQPSPRKNIKDPILRQLAMPESIDTVVNKYATFDMDKYNLENSLPLEDLGAEIHNNPYKDVHLNLFYEQAKWTILNGVHTCSSQEYAVFAALQLNIQESICNDVSEKLVQDSINKEIERDIEKLKDELRLALSNNSHIEEIDYCPELRVIVPHAKIKKKNLSLNNHEFLLHKTILSIMNPKDGVLLLELDLKSAEIEGKFKDFSINIKVFADTINFELICIKFKELDQYASWLTALTFTTFGRTLKNTNFHSEVNYIKTMHALLSQSKNSDGDKQIKHNINNFIPLKFKKLKKFNNHVRTAYNGLKHMNVQESKLMFIKIWQQIKTVGLIYFNVVVDIGISKHKEVCYMVFAPNRIMLIDIKTNVVFRTDYLYKLQNWGINWDETSVDFAFNDSSYKVTCQFNCELLHETVGTTIFLFLKNSDDSAKAKHLLFNNLITPGF
ncbi:Fermitin family 3 [Intoshia linei]|uniref:Fermitin family 3 n=1 Tax=Intoshia linei TaxID=1819745 RepID=A0A177B5S1_9BILA|nr:Fermitin family 3 [Intoshia linei]